MKSKTAQLRAPTLERTLKGGALIILAFMSVREE